MRRFPLMALLGIVLATTPAVGQTEGIREKLLDGVREVAAPGSPGSIAVYAPGAEALVVGKAGAGGRAAVVAVAKLGRGRVAAFAHDGYFSRDQLAKADTGRMVANVARWAAGGKKSARIGVIRPDGMVEFLNGEGFTAAKVSAQDSLDDVDALVLTPSGIDVDQAERVRAFVQAGGGLLAAATGWGWQQGSKAPMSEFVGNRILAGSGLAWTNGFAGRTSDQGYSTGESISAFTNASVALDALRRGRTPDADDFAAGLEGILLALRSLPEADAKFRTEVLKTLRNLRGVDMVPTSQSPASKKDMLRRFAIGLGTALVTSEPVEDVRAIPAAADFPGAVDARARRVTRKGEIDLSIPRWHSLGLYAPPGGKVTISGPDTIGSLKLHVRIGSHTDGLWHHDTWERMPEISRQFPIEGPRTVVASAFGGMIYLDVPEKAPREQLPLTIAGAVEAPFYQLGETKLSDWKTIRNRPAPWAELAGRNVIFTVPSALARQVDDPEALMKFWDEVVAAQDAMASSPRRRSPERIVVDRQISAGYMHSGYPIMCPIDGSAVTALDLSKLRAEGTWGHFHELGHNHQNGDWTFSGTGEVTNNVLAIYVFDKVLKLPYDSGHDAIRGKAMRTERIQEHIAKGAPFEKWKSDPFLALMMYVQLYEAFGWEPFERVFAEYPKLPRSERPKNDEAKRDQWMVRFSQAVGKNLGPFFQTWGVPTSQSARDSIQELPAWMPPELDAKSGR